MKRRKNIRWAAFAAAALMYLAGLWSWKETESYDSLVPLVLSRPISAEDGQKIWDAGREDEASVGFCFWGETGEQMFMTPMYLPSPAPI